jgi:uncharacterized protein YqgV (UPF0045/DUF77 family)
MAMIDISVVPVGTGSPSVSEFVAGAVNIVKNEAGIKYRFCFQRRGGQGGDHHSHR